MKVSEIMTRGVAACSPGATMADAASLMWKHGCGSVLILAADGTVMGLITDRDICRAALAEGERIQDMGVLRAGTQDVAVLSENDDVETALGLMTQRRVRRLPVVDAASKPVGILSLIDLARACEGGRGRPGVSPERVAATMAAISRRTGG